MPMDRKLYPPDWDTIATGIKDEVDWCCEFCGRACVRPDEAPGDFVERIKTTAAAEDCPVVADFKAYPRRYLLTVAHLDHVPANCNRDNLKALCTPCHCRYDLKQMGLKQQLKRERHGQLRLDWELAQKLEGLQLALFPDVVAPYWVENPKPPRAARSSQSAQPVQKAAEAVKWVENASTIN